MHSKVTCLFGYGVVVYLSFFCLFRQCSRGNEAEFVYYTQQLCEGNAVYDIAYNGDYYVAVGGNENGGVIVISRDRTNWQVISAEKALSGVVWGNELFIAVGKDGFVLTSVDGSSWDKKQIESGIALYDIIWNNQLFVAVGEGCIYTSTNGQQWTKVYEDSESIIKKVHWNGKQFVAVGNKVIVSTDGSNWNSTDTSYEMNDITWGNQRYIAVGPEGGTYFSYDGMGWISVPNVVKQRLNTVTYVNHVFIAAGDDGTVITSTDGLKWHIKDSPVKVTFHKVNWILDTYFGLDDRGNLTLFSCPYTVDPVSVRVGQLLANKDEMITGGEKITATTYIHNHTDVSKSFTAVLGLFNQQNRLVNAKVEVFEVPAGSSTSVMMDMDIPFSGNSSYYAQFMIWDEIRSGKPLTYKVSTLKHKEYEDIAVNIDENHENVYKVKGIITDNFLLNIDKTEREIAIQLDPSVPCDQVAGLTEISAKVGGTNADLMIGYYVEAYVLESNSERYLLWASPEPSKNKKTILYFADIDQYLMDDNKLLYRLDNGTGGEETRELILDPNLIVVFNGVKDGGKDVLRYYINRYGEDNQSPIVFIDNDSDNVYEYVSITEYYYVVIDEVVEGNVLAKSSRGIYFNNFSKYSLFYNGTLIEPSDLKKNDVLSIALYDQGIGEYMYAFVTRNHVVGVVTDLDYNWANPLKKCTVDGKDYEFSYFYEGDTINNNMIGRTVMLYLDIEGKVVFLEKIRTDKYAMLYDANRVEGTNEVEFTLFTAEGEWVTYTAADTIKICGESISSGGNISYNNAEGTQLSIPSDGNESKIVKRQLVTYELDTSNKLKALNFAQEYSYDDVFRVSDYVETGLYINRSRRLGRYHIAENTVMFNVNGNGEKQEDYSVITPEWFVDGEEYSATVYDASFDNVAGAIVTKNLPEPVWEEPETVTDYAILYDVNRNAEKEDIIEFELLTANDGWWLLQTKDIITIEGCTKADNGDIVKFTSDLNPSYGVSYTDASGEIQLRIPVANLSEKIVKEQLVKIEYTTDGVLNKIVFPFVGKTENEFSLDVPETRLVYSQESNQFGDYIITDNTIIFDVSSLGSYSIIDRNTLVDNETYLVSFYDTNESNEVKVMVTKNAAVRGITENAPFFVISSVSESRDENGNRCFIFRGLQEGNSVTLSVPENVSITRLKEADNILVDEEWNLSPDEIKGMVNYVIQYSLNTVNEVDNIRVVYAPGEDFYSKAFTKDVNKKQSDLVIIYGLVTDKRSGRLEISELDSSYEINAVNVTGATFTMINFNYNNPVRKSSLNDIVVDSSLVLVREYDGAVKEVIILNGVNR